MCGFIVAEAIPLLIWACTVTAATSATAIVIPPKTNPNVLSPFLSAIPSSLSRGSTISSGGEHPPMMWVTGRKIFAEPPVDARSDTSQRTKYPLQGSKVPAIPL